MKRFLEFIFRKVASRELDTTLAKSIIKEYQEGMEEHVPPRDNQGDIAVIGVSCNFGRADSPEEFWGNLVNGIDCLQEVPQDRWKEEARYSDDKNAVFRSYTKWGSFIRNAGKFDSEFFGYSDRSSLITDPQQRLFLHLCWEALEFAGYGSSKSREGSSIGVFVGARGNVYKPDKAIKDVISSKLTRKEKIEFFRSVLLGKAPNMIAAAVSNFLNLKGPSMVMDTACSSSLVSVHFACQSILSGDCDMAIAGGVDLIVDPHTYVYLSQINALSPDGKCQTFDKNANGYVPGEGGGAIILKPMKKAIEDRDNILAVIKGSAVNNDGYTVGVTTPDAQGQKDVIKKALDRAGVSPDTVTLIEAHGTGTFLGDPVEFKALTEVFREKTLRTNYCALGAVKTNIGHLHSAAGIASMIKVILSLYNRRIPATLNCIEPNPRFNLDASPFYVAQETKKWVTDGAPRRAGISSFGFGGTNCHIILEENTAAIPVPVKESGHYLGIYSAKSQHALKSLLEKHAEFIAGNEAVNPLDYSYTLNTGRELFEECIMLGFSNMDELKQKLDTVIHNDMEVLPAGTFKGSSNQENNPRLVLMLPGQGSQYHGMTRQLYENVEGFREAFDQCDELFKKYMGMSFKEIVFSDNLPRTFMNETNITQPVVFAINYCIARMWIAMGLKPDAVMGHSIGEYAAACIAGVFTLEDALKIVVARGRLMHSIPVDGGMMVVFSDESTVKRCIESILKDKDTVLSISAYNGPKNIVVAGTKEGLRLLNQKLAGEGIKIRELAVSHPFHCPLMEPILDEFRKEFFDIKMSKAKIAVVSNVTGDFKYEFDAEYWLNHILKPVNFGKSIEMLAESDFEIFLEAGPGTTLVSMAKQIESLSGKTLIPTINPQKRDMPSIIEAAADLTAKGLELNTSEFYRGSGSKKIILPCYPFSYKTYWINQEEEQATGADVKLNIDISEEISHKKLSFALFDDFYEISDAEVCLEKKVRPGELQVIEDHRVNGEVVMPGVCFWEMAQIAALFTFGKIPAQLKGIAYPGPLKLNLSEETKYRLILNKQSGRFNISALKKADGRWDIVTTGSIDFAGSSPELGVNIEDSIRRMSDNCCTGTELNEIFSSKGLDYREKFYSVKNIWGGYQEALVELKAEKCRPEEKYLFHPGLVDGALQGIARVGRIAGDKRAFVPYKVGQVNYSGLIPDECYGYIKLTDYDSQKGAIEFDIKITDKHGNIKVQVLRMCLRVIAKNVSEIDSVQVKVDRCIIPSWEAKPLLESAKYEKIKNILLLAADRQQAEAFHRQLERDGITLITVFKGSNFREEGKNCYTINPLQKQDYQALFQHISSQGLRVDAVLHCFNAIGNANIPQSLKEFDEALRMSVHSLVYILQGNRKSLAQKAFIAMVANNAFLVEKSDRNVQCSRASALGVLRTIPLEYENIRCSLIDIGNAELTDGNTLGGVLSEIKSGLKDAAVSIREKNRFVLRFKDKTIEDGSSQSLVIKDGGVYVITGGLGGVGLEIGKAIASKFQVKLCLIGRTGAPKRSDWEKITDAASMKKIAGIKAIEAAGSEVLVLEADVCQEAELSKAFETIRSKFGNIHGIIHAAGVIKDMIINNATDEAFDEVLKPKAAGTWLLDRVSQKDDLDFFVIFSAMVTALGNIGQANYAAANAFEDSFGIYRNEIKKRRTIIINWGLWGETGFVADDFHLEGLKKKGVIPLTSREAVEAFFRCLSSGLVQIGIAKFSDALTDKLLNPDRHEQPPETDDVKVLTSEHPKSKIATRILSERDLENAIKAYLSEKVGAALGDTTKRVDYKTSFLDAGLDSLTIVDLSDNFEAETGIKLYPTVFFEYPTIIELTRFLILNNKDQIEKYMNMLMDKSEATKSTESSASSEVTAANIADYAYARLKNDAEEETEKLSFDRNIEVPSNQDIAVIGMAGYFPGAENIQKFWENLMEGVDSVVDVPGDRWDWRLFYHPQKQKGKTYSKKGGFIDGIDQFDPLFFNISPREAAVMDPQQRFALKTVWEALEDAGYADGKLSNTRTGVYVGVTNHNYFDESFNPDDSYSGLATANAIVANRVSYFLNLQGPSFVLDTQCSSSLVAVNEACKSIILGECDHAIAAGINLLIPKDYYILLCQMEAISKDGKCKSFDKKANGFISGEGAGALLLKRYSDAIRDGDNIHCIIKGSEVNHDGRSGSLTAPNSRSQAALIQRCIERSGVNPETITYIEAHGTGTPLGDPIEIRGLTEAYSKYTAKKQYCAIGSVKSNIGHLEAAAGMAAMMKVILAMKNKVIPRSLHFEEPNPYINFNESPFYVSDRPKDWTTNGFPRRAGISSFGMGGTNAHIIIEEPPEYIKQSENKGLRAHLVTLSARSEAALRKHASHMAKYLEENSKLKLADVCHSLNTGRYQFSHRLALIASSTEELAEQFKALSMEDGSLSSLNRNRMTYGKLIGNDVVNPVSITENIPCADIILLPAVDEQIMEDMLSLSSELYKINDCFRHTLNEYDTILINSGKSPVEAMLREGTLKKDKQHLAYAIVGFDLAILTMLKDMGIQAERYYGWGFRNASVEVINGNKSIEEALSLISDIDIVKSSTKLNLGDIHPGCIAINIGGPAGLDYFGKDTENIVVYNLFHGEHKGWEIVLDLAARLYSEGCNLNLDTVNCDSNKRKISLPTYPFESKRHWHKGKPLKKAVSIENNSIEDDSIEDNSIVLKAMNNPLDNYLYDWTWKEVKQDKTRKLQKDGVWILFCDSNGLYLEIEKRLKLQNQIVILIHKGEKYGKAGAFEYTMNPGVEGNYEHVFTSISSEYHHIDTVINLWCLERTEGLENRIEYLKEALEKSVYALFGIAKGIYKAFGSNSMTRLLSVTSGGFMIDGKDSTITADKYPVHVLSRLVSAEIGSIRSSSLDMPCEITDLKECASNILNFAQAVPGYREMAVRDGKTYVRFLAQVRIGPKSEGINIWKQGGVYVITGGAAGIGYEIAKNIIKNGPAAIAIIGRTRLPKKAIWNEYIKENRGSETSEKLRNLVELENMGANVQYYTGDISDLSMVDNIFEEIRSELGGITGVFQCAGVKRDAIMTAKSFKDFDTVISPKAYGLYNILKVLSDSTVEFVVAFSSIASTYGTPGQSDYAAANAFMDAYVRQWSKKTGIYAASINWPLWKSNGMSVPGIALRKMEKEGILLLDINEGITVLEKMLAYKERSNVTVLKLSNPDKFIDELIKTKTKWYMENQIVLNIETEKHIETKINNAALDETRAFLLSLLSDLLVIDRGDLDTGVNLGDYGMDSLSIKDALEKLEKHYNESLQPSLFEEYPTIESLAVHLSGRFTESSMSAKSSEKIEIAKMADNEKFHEEAAATPDDKAFDETRDYLLKMLSEVLVMEPEDIDQDVNFGDYGMDSLSIKDALDHLEKHYKSPVETSLFEEYPTLRSMADYLSKKYQAENIQKPEIVVNEAENTHDIKIQKNTGEGVISKKENIENADTLESILEKLYLGEASTASARSYAEEYFKA